MSGTLELGRHAGFVLAAYGATAVVLLGLILNTWLRARRYSRAAQSVQSKVVQSDQKDDEVQSP